MIRDSYVTQTIQLFLIKVGNTTDLIFVHEKVVEITTQNLHQRKKNPLTMRDSNTADYYTDYEAVFMPF